MRREDRQEEGKRLIIGSLNLRVYFPRLNPLQIEGALQNSLSEILKTLHTLFPQIHIFQCF